MNRYEKVDSTKRFVSLWMNYERKVMKSDNVSAQRYAEITKFFKTLLDEEYVRNRDLEKIIHFLFSTHPYSSFFQKPYKNGYGSRPYDVWFIRKNYYNILFAIGDVENSIPPKYIDWNSSEFRNDLATLFPGMSKYQQAVQLNDPEVSMLYKTIKYNDEDDWEYFLHAGGNKQNFKRLFSALHQHEGGIPKKFVIWYFEFFKKGKKPIKKKPVKQKSNK